MGFWEWLTGRDEKESDVYANFDKVSDVVGRIGDIATTTVGNAQSAIDEAFGQLTAVKGFSEYVATLNTNYYDPYFDGIAQSINALGEKLQGNADSIKEYEEAPWYEKLGSSFVMFSAKATEGLVGIIEDLGDGIASLGGWAVGGIVGLFDKDAGQSIKDGVGSFVEAEWSHDMFNFYYESDFAKKSVFKEDSGFANATKIVSKTVGYVALTIATAGIGSGAAGASAAASAAGTASKVAAVSSKVFTAMSKLGSAATWAGTGLAFVSGVGTGTESGLRKGKDFDSAFGEGMAEGGKQAAIAFVGGKIGDKFAKSAKAKDLAKAQEGVDTAQASVDEATKTLEKASEAFKQAGDDLVNPDIAKGFAQNNYEAAMDAKIAAQQSLDDASASLSKAQQGLESVQNSSLTRDYIYNGKLSGKIYDKGYSIGEKTMGNIAEKGLIKGTAANIGAAASKAKSAASNAKETLKSGASTVKDKLSNPGSVTDTLKSGASTVKTKLSSAGSTVKEAVKTAVKNPKDTISKVAQGAKNVVTSPTTPRVVATGANQIINENLKNTGLEAASAREAKETFKSQDDYSNYVIDPTPPVDGTPSVSNGGGNSTGGTPSGSSSTGGGSSSSGGSSSGGGSSSSGGSTGGSVSGGSSTGGGSVSGGSTTGGTTGTNNNSETQLKTKVEDTTTPNTDTKTNPSTTDPNTDTKTEQPTTTTPTTTTPTTSTGDTTTYHTGGGYSGDGYYYSPGSSETTDTTDASSTLSPLDESLINSTSSIDEIIKGSKYTKIPTTSKPITTKKSTGGSSVIPIAAGLSAAAAAGLGAKAYMDNKRNNDVDDEDDEFETEEWDGEDDNIDISYDENTEKEYLDDDDYSYEEEPVEKYDARNNEELADLQ